MKVFVDNYVFLHLNYEVIQWIDLKYNFSPFKTLPWKLIKDGVQLSLDRYVHCFGRETIGKL